MKRKNTFAVISVLSFLISGMFTIALFTSNSVGKIAIMMMFASAVVFEMSKWCLLWEGFSNRHNGIFRTILIFLWASVTIGSIVASSGYVINESNRTQNKAVISSTQYKNAEQSRQILIDSYNKKSEEVEQLRKQSEELPKNYYSMKQNIMKNVSEKTAALSALTQKIQEPLKVSGVLNENGYSAFFSLFANLIGEDSKMVELFFFLALGIILELIANCFAYLYQKESGSSSTPNRKYFQKSNNSESKIGFKPQVVLAKKTDAARPIGFKIDTEKPTGISAPQNVHGFDDIMLDKYIDYIYDCVKADGSIDGYQTTATNLNYTYDQVRKMKNHCEHLGILKSDSAGRRTILLRPKENLKALHGLRA